MFTVNSPCITPHFRHTQYYTWYSFPGTKYQVYIILIRCNQWVIMTDSINDRYSTSYYWSLKTAYDVLPMYVSDAKRRHNKPLGCTVSMPISSQGMEITAVINDFRTTTHHDLLIVAVHDKKRTKKARVLRWHIQSLADYRTWQRGLYYKPYHTAKQCFNSLQKHKKQGRY